MAVNKVVYAATVLLDLTEDTVTSAAMRQGFTAHNKAGEVVTGSIEEKNSASLTVSGSTVTAPAGYYAAAATAAIAFSTLTVSSSNPSGGNNGDVWIKTS